MTDAETYYWCQLCGQVQTPKSVCLTCGCKVLVPVVKTLPDRGNWLHVIEVHAREYAGEETITTRVIVWSGRDRKGAQDNCDRLNRRRSGGLDPRYPIRYEVQECGEDCCSTAELARKGYL